MHRPQVNLPADERRERFDEVKIFPLWQPEPWQVRVAEALPQVLRLLLRIARATLWRLREIATEVDLPTVRASVATENRSGWLVLLCVAAWAVPGAGHLWLGRRSKGLVFLVALPLMFAIGLAIQGRLFPFAMSDPLVGLAALADLGIGVPYFVATALGLGGGKVLAVTYEYGNAYLIVAGLLNLLVVIDAYDIALGRK
jgi:uncharacterized protein DUF6677